MEDLGTYVDFPSPPNSMYYVYGESEQYLSESQSPNNSSYDATSAGDGSLSSRYPSPGHEDGESADSTEQQKPAAKRKRENRYKNAPPAVLSRRRAQNRASQRAYRERKDQRIKDLEQLLNDAKQRNDVLSQAYATLHAEYVALKSSQISDTGYPPQYDVAYGAAPHNMAALGQGGVDPLEMDSMFVYPDLNAGYTL
ncbi:hypothetical protein NEMBOFW57_004973 [Staphylotrichum longicolle]|uniref:Putative transcription factor kapC n=1 Tax=Staphylotrichum longicolle TaxID=669026 RepID=A0AAD4HVP3_9PEZI|nr:hypothetical protein NEMBOFW57_004973 [Staphylotrichum longicolle]